MQLSNTYLMMVRTLAKRRKRTVFLVGGALRDAHLKRPCTDFDFAVDQDAIGFTKLLARQMKGAFVLLDQEHGSARIVKEVDGKVWTFDFTDWRGKTIDEDLKLRDFTINAFALDIASIDDSKEIFKEVQGSSKDLKSKKIRMVSQRAFRDDPLRLLRAYTLQATLDFSIEPKTLAQIKKDVPLISSVAIERTREELFRILASPRAYETLQAMDVIALLPKIIPQITVMVGVKQGGYHHLDVWKHSLEVMHQLEEIILQAQKDEKISAYLNEEIGGAHKRYALLKMAALLHDIGKPQTRKQEGSRMTFHSHEHVGEGITRHVAKHLKLSVKERYFLENVVRMHLRPGYLSNFVRPSEKAVFRYMRDTKQEAVSLALLAMADQSATRGELTTEEKHNHHKSICEMIISRYFKTAEEVPSPRLISGDDLIKKLKLKPSPLFKKIITSVEEEVALGHIKTRTEALLLAKKLAKA